MNYLGLNAVLFAWLPFPALNFHTEWRIGSPGIEDAPCSSFSSTGTANRILTDSNICRSHQVNFDKWHVMGFRTLLVRMRGNIPRMEYNYITVALLCVLHGNRITFQVLLLLLLLALELRVDDGPLWMRTRRVVKLTVGFFIRHERLNWDRHSKILLCRRGAWWPQHAMPVEFV